MTQIKIKKQNILQSALKLANKNGWNNVSLECIAEDLGVANKELKNIFANKNEIVMAVLQKVNDDLLAANLHFDSEFDTAKDRLFDVIMYRFDLLNKERKALVSMLSPLKTAPENLWSFKKDFCYSMRSILEKAGVVTSSMIKEDAFIVALSVVYMLTVQTWLKDDSEDMAKTMSVLDQHLSKMFHLSSMLDGFLGRKTLWSDG